MTTKDLMNNALENAKRDIEALGFDVESGKISFNKCIEADLCEINENGCMFKGWFSIFGKKFEDKKFFYSYESKNMSLFDREKLSFNVFDVTKNVDAAGMIAIGFPFKNWSVKNEVLTINFRERNSAFRLDADSGIYVFNEMLNACEKAKASTNWIENLKNFHTKVEIVDSVFDANASMRPQDSRWEGFGILAILDFKNLICAYLKYIVNNRKEYGIGKIFKELSKVNFESFDEMYKDISNDAIVQLTYKLVSSCIPRWYFLPPYEDISIFKSSDIKITLYSLYDFILNHKVVESRKNIGDYAATDRTKCYEERSYIEV